jgi:hypothetical protein
VPRKVIALIFFFSAQMETDMLGILTFFILSLQTMFIKLVKKEHMMNAELKK